VSRADHALTAAAEVAKQAKTLKEACSGLPALEQGLVDLNHVTPPTGLAQAFAEEREGIFMLLGVMQDQRCSEDSGADADTIRRELGMLRGDFTRLQGVGVKP